MTLIEHTNFPNSQHHRALWSERSIVIPHKWHSEKFPHRNIICNIPPYIMHFSQLFSSLQRWSFWHRSAETCTAICAKRGGENDGRWNKKKKEASEWQNDYWHDDTVEKWCWWLSERMNGPGGVTEMLTFTSINSFSSSTWASHPRRSFGCISKNILKLLHPESQQVLPRLKFMNIWDRHHCNVRLGAALLSRWSRKFEFPDARVWREHETCESQGLKLIFTLYVDERWCFSRHC